MNLQVIIIYSYAFLVALGGIIGFVKAGSVPSLVMGLLFGGLLAISGYLFSNGKQGGRNCALILSLVLAFFFAYRFFLSMAFMPAGLMVLLSIIVAGVLSPRSKQGV